MSKLSAGDFINKKSDDIKSPDKNKDKQKSVPDKSESEPKENKKSSGLLKDTVKNSVTNQAHNVATEKTGIDTRALKVAGKATAKAAPVLAKVGLFAKLLDLITKMQLLLANMITGITAGIAGLLSSIMAVGAAIAKGFSAVVSFVSGIFNISGVVAAVMVIAGPALGTAVAVAVIVTSSSDAASTMIDDKLIDCRDKVNGIISELAKKDPSEETLKNAKICYSIFKGYGLTNIQIAGILGNWDTESGIDFTTVEGIYTEPHEYGEKTKAAIEGPNDYCINSLFPKYVGKVNINKNAYKGSDSSYYPGIGIAQFTGPAAEKLLGLAPTFNKEWYDVDFQIAFAISVYRKGYFSKMASDPETSTIEGSTKHFLRDYEGSRKLYKYDVRLGNAKAWLKNIEDNPDDWVEDTPEAESALEMIKEMGDVAVEGAIGKSKRDCVKTISADNSSIAAAAISYAHNSWADAANSKGTDLWQKVVEAIYPGDGTKESCDITVATAIRWSGGDIDYPPHSTANQYDHVEKSDKWTCLGKVSELKYDDLRPGDVFLSPKQGGAYGHTFLYVGKELVQKMRPDLADKSLDSVEGSIKGNTDTFYSPCLTNSATRFMSGNSGDKRPYKVYRLTKPDNSDKYKDVGL